MVSLLLIFIGAFLLFQVQPFIAKIILPYFGGGASVWTACLLFFQAFLLFGYFYAHKLSQFKNIKLQFIVHGVLLVVSLISLPIGLSTLLGTSTLNTQQPLLAILLQLTLAVGLPYFLLASTGPLVQRWLTFVDQAKLPYKLYSLSNFASLLALISFPFLFEPLFSASTQSWLWSASYILYVLLFGRAIYGLNARLVKGEILSKKEDTTPVDIAKHTLPMTLFMQILWTALAAVGVVLLVATTNAMTQNIPPVPFLWILPLCLYLLSFIICFHNPKWYVRTYFFALFSLSAVLAILMFFIGSGFDIVSQVVIYSCILFTACMICHGELAQLKPDANGLTTFYLLLSLGGFLGSVFVVFVAQNLFVQFLEFPLAILSVFILVVLANLKSTSQKRGLIALSLTCFILFSGVFLYVNQLYVKTDIHSARNFYGVLSVKDVEINGEVERRLIDGTTSHGTQSLNVEKRSTPLSYYRKETGVAIAFSQLRAFKQIVLKQPSTLNVGFIGLGAGTLAAYGKKGDSFQFFELNPAVIYAAKQFFTYIDDSAATVDVVVGDARVSLTKMLTQKNEMSRRDEETSVHFDLMVVDAFSGDSIPQHLLTDEAVTLYFKHLNKDGVLAVHVSNSHLNLLPLMRGLAAKQGVAIRYFHSAAEQSHEHDTQWVLLSNNQQLMNQTLIKAYQSSWPDDAEHKVLWTDNNSSLISVLK